MKRGKLNTAFFYLPHFLNDFKVTRIHIERAHLKKFNSSDLMIIFLVFQMQNRFVSVLTTVNNSLRMFQQLKLPQQESPIILQYHIVSI